MPGYELELYTRSSVAVASLTEAVLEEVKWTLNDIGQLSFSMLQDDEQIVVPKLVEHEVRCTIEGVTNPWQGPIWQDEEGPKSVKFDANNVASYLTRRFIDYSSLYYDDIPGGYDQLQIGWGLMQYAQGASFAQTGNTPIPSKSFNVTAASYAPSGRLRLRRYLRDDHSGILEMLQEFGGLRNFSTGEIDGFDWEIICYADGRREWTPYFPMKGSLKPQYALEWGRNISDFTVNADAKGLTTKTYCTGQSTGDTRLEANYEDAASSALYTQMVSVIDSSDQSDPDALEDRARTYTEEYKRPLITPELKAVAVPVELLGKIETGDRIPVKIDRGRTQIDDIYRVGEITWKPRPNTLELTLLPKVTL